MSEKLMNWFNKKNIFKLILVILALPFLMILLAAIFIKQGTNLCDVLNRLVGIDSIGIVLDLNKEISIGDFISYYFTIIGVEVTTILSYALLETSKKSNDLAEAINEKEEKRDHEIVRESALVTYYDLISKLNIVKELYQIYILDQINILEKEVNISLDWIKNIANLRNSLNRKELDIIIDLYENLLLIQSTQKSGEKEKIKSLLSSLSKKLFINILEQFLWMDFSGNIEGVLDSKYYIIISKINAIANGKNIHDIYSVIDGDVKVNQDDKNIKLLVKLNDDDTILSGTNSYNNKNLFYIFIYSDSKVVRGIFKSLIDSKLQTIFDCDFNEEGEFNNGFVTYSYKPDVIKYQGNIVDKKYDGKGTLYYENPRGKIEYKGLWSKGEKVEGEYFGKKGKSIQYFKGKYNSRSQPLTGVINIYEYMSYKDSFEYKGLIEGGKLLNGRGYTKNSVYVDEKYLENHPEYVCEYINKRNTEYYYEEQDEIPQDVIDKWHEADIRREAMDSKEQLQDLCVEVVELLEAKWENGEKIISPDDFLYKKYFGVGNKE